MTNKGAPYSFGLRLISWLNFGRLLLTCYL